MVYRMNFKRQLYVVLSPLLLWVGAMASDLAVGFVIEDIRIEGLQRFGSGVVISRLPVGIGDTISAEDTATIIKSLYKTGYFKTIDVLRDGNILLIQVQENPTINEVNYAGVEVIGDQIEVLMNSMGLKRAAIFKQSNVDKAVQALEEIYREKNFYKAQVKAVVSPLSRNRVDIAFQVEEGDAAAIRSITFAGNSDFSDFTLSREMELEPKSVLNFLTDNYQFSASKLETDINRLKTFYLEEGYLDAQVNVATVDFSEDQLDIDITIQISEGAPYQIGNIDINVDVEDIDQAELQALVSEAQQVGDVYSGTASQEVINALRAHFQDKGFMYADVEGKQQTNSDNMVALVYVVSTNKVVFVRQINIVGNELTANEIIRRELSQFENERYSYQAVEASRRRISRLGYFSAVNISPVPVSDNEIDLLIEVVEAQTGEISIGAGVSSDAGVSYNLGFSNKNIFGTGNDFSFAASSNDGDKAFSFELDEHYYTEDGVSRHIAARYSDETTEDISTYSLNQKSAEYGFSFPFTDDGKYNLRLAYNGTEINNEDTLDTFYDDFTEKYGTDIDNILLMASATYDSRDSSFAPSSGHKFTFSSEVALPGGTNYYKYGFLYNFYKEIKPLMTKPVLHLRSGYDHGSTYGSGEVYPFYERFYLGGSNNLRGYKASSIGFTNDNVGDAIGGRSRLYGTAELAFPADWFKNQQLFVVPFLDAGAVGRSIDYSSARVTYGLELRWVSPVGPLRFSYAQLLKDEKEEDEVQNFQFSISTF